MNGFNSCICCYNGIIATTDLRFHSNSFRNTLIPQFQISQSLKENTIILHVVGFLFPFNRLKSIARVDSEITPIALSIAEVYASVGIIVDVTSVSVQRYSVYNLLYSLAKPHKVRVTYSKEW